MGFASGSCAFSRFRIIDPVPDEVILNALESLKKHSFKDIDELPEMRSFGWVCFEDMLDSDWKTAPPQKADYLVFSLRLDTRRIPAGVIKKHLSIALRGEKQKNPDQKFIPRERVKEIKERVLLRLRERFLPVPGEFNVIWNVPQNTVWLASVQDKMIDLFMETFLNTFNLHLEELTPYTLAASILPEKDLDKLDRLEETRFTLGEG